MNIDIHFQTVKPPKIGSGGFVNGGDTQYKFTKDNFSIIACIPLTKTEWKLHLLKKIENRSAQKKTQDLLFSSSEVVYKGIRFIQVIQSKKIEGRYGLTNLITLNEEY